MKLEQQVLTIDQVRELQELGFDVEKYASMCWVKYTSDEEPYKETYSLTVLDESCYETSYLSPIPTLTIGDIIYILPDYVESLYKSKYYLSVGNIFVDYYSFQHHKPFIRIMIKQQNLIDALFEMLKCWIS